MKSTLVQQVQADYEQALLGRTARVVAETIGRCFDDLTIDDLRNFLNSPDGRKLGRLRAAELGLAPARRAPRRPLPLPREPVPMSTSPSERSRTSSRSGAGQREEGDRGEQMTPSERRQAEAIALLERSGRWVSAGELRAELGYSEHHLRQTLESLIAGKLVRWRGERSQRRYRAKAAVKRAASGAQDTSETEAAQAGGDGVEMSHAASSSALTTGPLAEDGAPAEPIQPSARKRTANPRTVAVTSLRKWDLSRLEPVSPASAVIRRRRGEKTMITPQAPDGSTPVQPE